MMNTQKRWNRKEKKMRDRSERITLGISLPLLVLWSITLVYPFLWALMNSFKTPIEYFKDSFALPEIWHFDNWKKAFTFLEVPKGDPWNKAGFWELVWNSLWRTFGDSFLTLASAAMIAYVCAKYANKYTKFLYALSVTVMIIPIVGAMPASYKLNHQIGMVNTPLRLLLNLGTGIGSANFLILYSFFLGISWTYAEAVFIDGGGHMKVFLKIMIPQAMPILTALFITTCITQWNDYLTSLMYMSQYPNLATGLYLVETASLTANNKPIYFACILLSVVPVLVVFWAFSDKIMNNVSIGGIKG